MRNRDGGGRTFGEQWRRPARPLLAWLVFLGLACSGCSAASSSNPAGASPTPVTPGRESLAPPRPVPSSCPARIFSQMSQAQRVGQLFLVGIAGEPVADVAQAVRRYHFGSLLFESTSTASAAEIRRMSRAVRALASPAATAQIGFFIAANQEGGQVQQLQGPGFLPIPPALAQGQLSPRLLQRQAAAWGRELKSAGVNLDLAPVMDVVPSGTAGQNEPVGALEREFGYDPVTVAAHGVAFIRGMQQAGVASTAKHFPGLGRVLGNTDFTAGVVDTTTGPDDPYLGSFQAAIVAGVPFVLVALATYTRIDPRHLAAFSSPIMRGLLRGRMRFRGVIVSDDLGAAAAVAGLAPAARGIGFLAAGGDLITSQSLSAATAMDHAIVERAAVDPAFRATVNSAVMSVLDAKQAYHLMPCR